MTENNDLHTPNPDFTAYLARDIVRSMRHSARFSPPVASGRRRTVALVAASAIGTVSALAVGLVLGTSTGYASARFAASSADSTIGPLAEIPMTRALSLACTAISLSAARQAIPVIDLSPGTTKSTTSFVGVFSVRPLSGGRLLVNDGGAHRMYLLDSTLKAINTPLDSVEGRSNSYGPMPSALMAYSGDSSLFAHRNSQTFLKLDGQGKIVGSIVPPNLEVTMQSMMGADHARIDPMGRLIYKATTVMSRRNTTSSEGTPSSSITAVPDSNVVVRVDFDARRVDTLGRILERTPSRMTTVPTLDGTGTRIKRTINPLPAFDAMAVLTDGTVAFVRGQDYHVDWLLPDGSRRSTAKLPFDWKRLSDEDKQRLVDSAREAQAALAISSAQTRPPEIGPGSGGGGRGGRGGAPAGRGGPPEPVTEFSALNEIADYYPPIRRGAAKGDADGNLWVLPATSAQSKQGELVYDVISVKDGLFQRVRLPVGRSIVGFGKGGVVYLLSGDRTTGFSIERTKLPLGK